MYIQQAINLYVQTIRKYKDAAESKGIRTATYQGGGEVSIDGMAYDAAIGADINLRSGQVVYVALDQAGTKAVILG